MKLKGAKVLVTGAGGFIGSHLTEELVRHGASVRAMVHYNSRNDWGMLEQLPDQLRRELDVFTGDIRDPFAVNEAVKGSKVVFHLASLIGVPYSYHAPASYVETNVQGTLNVMQACLGEGVEKVVHTSTSEVYGTACYTPIDEQHPLQAQSPYSASKIAADKIAESFHVSYGLPVTTIRPFNTFGPRQSARAIVPTIVTQALTRDKIELGLLSPTRDLTYVRDTADGFIKLAETSDSAGRLINIGSGQGLSIGALAEIIKIQLGIEKEIIGVKERLRPPRSEVMMLICDNRKAKEILNWEPRTSLEEGMKQIIAYCKENIKLYKTAIYGI